MGTRGRVRAMVGALAAVAAVLVPAPSQALTPPARIAGVATHPWRLEAHSMVPLVGLKDPWSRERTFSMMQLAGLRYARVDLKWNDVEAKGPRLRDWSDFDVLVKTAQSYHVQLLPMVSYTPGWANGHRHSFSFPTHASDFERFMAAAFRRYPYIKAWEIWNEPNYSRFSRPRPDPAKFVQMLRAAYRARASAGSHAKLISGGLAPGVDISVPRFFDAMARLGAFKYIDGFGIHPYSGAPPDQRGSFFLTLPELHERLLRIGKPGVGIWATEYGFPADVHSPVSQREQVHRLVTAYAIAAGWPWLRNLTWYGMRDDCTEASNIECRYGLLTQDFRTKWAYGAFADVIRGRLPKLRSSLDLRATRTGRGRRRRYFLNGSAFTPGSEVSSSWITLHLNRRWRHRVRYRRTFTLLQDGQYDLALGRLRPGSWWITAEFPGTGRYLPSLSRTVSFRVPRLRHRAHGRHRAHRR